MTDNSVFNEVPIELTMYGTLFSLTNRIQTIGDEVFSDITMKQHFLLVTLMLFNDNYPTLKDVADHIGCSYQNVKKMAAILEKDGYLRIVRDTEDKRKYKLIITDKVKTISYDIERDINDFINVLYKDLSHDQMINTIKALKQMEHNLEAFRRK